MQERFYSTAAVPIVPAWGFTPQISVQRQSNSRGWLHRVFPRKRHQMRHLCDLVCLLAKQVLSQLSYTPTSMALLTFYGTYAATSAPFFCCDFGTTETSLDAGRTNP